MTSSNHTELLLIGGGVLGAFHAYHAQRRGVRVVMLERHAAPRGASVRNFGQVVPSGSDQHWQQFGRESLQTYKSIQSQCDISVRENGTIYIASDEEELTLIEELCAINADNDYQSELWTVQKCLDRYPQLRADYCRGGLFFPQEVSVNPRVMIHRLHQHLSEQPNYYCHFQTCVRALADDGHQVTAETTDGRVFTAQKAILCCGSEFQTLYPKMFHDSGLKTVKLQMLRLKPQPQVRIPGNVLTGLSIRRYESFSQCPSWMSIKSRESSDSFSKRWGIHILFKQEADGGIILGDSHEYASADSKGDLTFDLRSDINEYFIREGQRIFDLPKWYVEASWYGMYCQTDHPSGVFSRTISNRIDVVTGIGGKGMTTSAGFAKHHLGEIYND